jgi:lipoyl(octanoyl) transferase
VSDPQSTSSTVSPPGRALVAYLLGEVGFEACQALQRRLVYDAGGDPDGGSVVVCDHPAGVTVGRDGSWLHIRLDPRELTARRWPVRWVARGGGVMVHAPGQIAVYPILPLARLGLTPAGYVRELCEAVAAVLSDAGVPAAVDDGPPGVAVGRRRVAHVGVAVRNGVTTFGAVVNVSPDLELFRGIDCDGRPVPMTSVDREAPAPVRPAAVRQWLVEEVARRFGYDRVSAFHTHPALAAGLSPHAPVAAGS